MKRQNFQLNYKYHNTTKKDVEIWFSEPKESSTQQNITTTPNMTPDRMTEHAFLNTLWYFRLKPGQNLNIKIDYKGSRRDKSYKKDISIEEKNFFLRSTNLIPVSEEIKKEAEAIVEGVTTDIEKAKKIFHNIIKNYKYSTNFSDRGIVDFKASKKGDCGEFGALFCAYCRSLNIPARMLYGTWTLKKFSPHAWCEIYIENEGWVPVDPSMGRIKLYFHPFINLSSAILYGVFSNKRKYFGNHEGKRLAFSIDPERELTPRYTNSIENLYGVNKECIAGEKIAWGYESLKGKAPFLQPIYPKLHSVETPTPIKLLFGEWRGKHTSTLGNLTYKAKLASFQIGISIIFLEIINEYIFKAEILFNILPLFSIPLILIGTILSIIRNEGNFLIYVLGFLFTLSFLSGIGELLQHQ